MSWSIVVTGEIDAARQRVAAASVNGQEQGEAARALILKCLETVPTNGVDVRATGHQDQWSSTLSVEVRGVRLALDTAEPAREEVAA